MISIEIHNQKTIYLNSYHPLCINEMGMRAIHDNNYPPFIDGSCRREPDFSFDNPTISSLCRGGIFAPNLRKDDIIIYMTVHRKYTGDDIPNNRLVSILQVERIYHTHEEYYNELVKENRQAKIPSNCLVEGNLPHLFAQTTGEFLPNNEIKKYLLMGKEEQLKFGIEKIRFWDKTYQRRVKRWPMLIKTDAHFMNLYDPSPIFKTDFQNIFNTGVPFTLRPMKIEIDEFKKLCSVCGIKLTVIDFI